MTTDILDIETRVGLQLQDHQREALTDAQEQVRLGAWLRLCLYHRTGAGKTYTSLAAAALAGAQQVLVIAPPITHDRWAEWGRLVGVEVEAISHAKFRQPAFKTHRDQALIVDEFHLLGGQTGQGWLKLRRMAPGLQAPLILASATPNYNDAERVYCIWHILDPGATKGGFLNFLHKHCTTEENFFGKMPIVTGFHKYADAEDFLRQLPRVHYVEDEVIKEIHVADVPVQVDVPPELTSYGVDRRRGRIIASRIEGMHSLVRHQIIDDDGLVRAEVYEAITELVGQVATPTLIFCNHREVAEALAYTVRAAGEDALLITGKTSTKDKHLLVQLFRSGDYPVLIGTASLATGTDGIDKMCDHLLIVDDTDDDALRRQLMGRILPRGLDFDVSKKIVSRLVYF